MPRFCEICHAEFKYASELADHLKLSSCSYYTTMFKCPYCDRNDFVDEDSLNRHLTYNRKCSRADVKATDNLSILAPDNTINIRNNRISPGTMDTFGLGSSLSDQPDISSHEGNLVNYVNAYDVHLWHQMQTALVTDETRQMLFTASAARMTKDDMGKVHKEVTVLSVIGDKTSHQQATHQSDKETLSNLHPNPAPQRGSDLVENPRSDMDLPNRCEGVETEFEVVGAHNYSSEDDDDTEQVIRNDDGEYVHSSEEEEESSDNETNHGNADQIEANNNALPISTKPLYDNHTCHHASPELDSLVELYTILDKRGVANSVFDDVAKWAWLNSHTFGSQPPMKRRVVVEKVFQHVRGERYKEFMTPRQKVLRLSTGRHVALTYFPLELMICDMLSNCTLMEKENLLFSNYNNPTDDSLPPTSGEQCYGEVNSGSWWKNATRHECKGPQDVLWPIIMFIDAMKVDNLAGKRRLEPITFTFSRFKRWVRNQENAWRTWGYIEEVKQSLCTPDEVCSVTPKQRLQEYHDILRFFMSDLQRIQRKGIKWKLDFGEDGQHDVILRLPLQFIIGDCEGHDKLVGRYKGHTMNMKGLCRDCDVPTANADDETWKCCFFHEDELKDMSEEELNAYSFHNINNGFEGVSWGGSHLGIRGALNPEVLHLFKAGHCEWIFDGFVFSLSANASSKTKTVSQYIVNMNRGQSDRGFPNMGTFRDGILKGQGVNLQGHEKHARLFFVYIMLCCSDFVELLDSSAKRGTEYDVAFYSDFIYLIEQSLGFYEWTMQREHKADTIVGADGTTGSSIAQISIRRYMFLLKHTCPREAMGKNFKMTKFHQCLHFVPNIGLHGSLRNTDSSPTESMAKGNVKDPASHTQRVTSKLTFQTGKRYMETLTFREFKRLKSESGDETEGKPYINKCTVERMLSENRRPVIHDHDTSSIFTGGTRFSISLDVDQPEGVHNVSFFWNGKGKQPLKGFDELLLQALGKRLFAASDGGVVSDTEVPGFTAIKIDDITYTAHPFFKNDHTWKDWVYIQWDGYP
jgi:hypothetical protein